MFTDPPALADVEIWLRFREAGEISVDGFHGGPYFGRDPLGFLVVCQDAGQQEADDEDRAADAARQQRVRLEKFQVEIVYRGFHASEQDDDGADGEEQSKPLAESEIRRRRVELKASEDGHLL